MSTKVKNDQPTTNQKNSTNTFWASIVIILPKVKGFFRDFILWLWSFAIGFAPLLVKTIRECEDAKNYTWERIYTGVFGDLDVMFSLITILYALYLQSERVSHGDKGFVKTCRGVSVTGAIILLFFWLILYFNPYLQDIAYNSIRVMVNSVLLILAVVWGVIVHIMFAIYG